MSKEIKSASLDVEKLIKGIDNGKITTDLPWQRKEGLLDNYHQSLLIDTMFRGYKIPAIWITKTPTENFDKNSVIDGVQRTSTFYSFIKGKFKLHKDMKPVTYTAEDTGEEITWETAGKKFSQLPEYLQSKIMDYSLSVIEMFGFDDNEIEEQFLRLNSGAVFQKAQKIKVILGTRLAEEINEIESMPFWERTSFTPRQRKEGAITACLIQCLMLITGFECEKYGANEIEKFCVQFAEKSEKYTDDEIDYLNFLFGELNDFMADSDANNKFLKKINIPILIMNVDKFYAYKGLVEDDDYTHFLDEWVEHNAYKSGYLDFCGQGSTNGAKVKGRIKIMEEWLDAYADHKINGSDFDKFVREHSIADGNANDDDKENTDVDKAFSVFNGMNADFAAMVDNV